MSIPGWGSIAAALGRSQELSDLVAAEVVAVVHHCVYCYTSWNASASGACAGGRGDTGPKGAEGPENVVPPLRFDSASMACQRALGHLQLTPFALPGWLLP